MSEGVHGVVALGAERGARTYLALARRRHQEALERLPASTRLEFPNTAYFLPVIYAVSGRAVRTLDDVPWVLDRAERLIRTPSADPLCASGADPTPEAGMGALWLMEVIEALRYAGVGPATAEGIWLGAADDVVMRARGVEFIEGSTPGFAAVTGAAPSLEAAVALARQMQEMGLYVFVAGSEAAEGEVTEGEAAGGEVGKGKEAPSGPAAPPAVTFVDQLAAAGVQLGWETRLVPLGREVSSHVHSLGLAARLALAFGRVEPGDGARLLEYVRERVHAVFMVLGRMHATQQAMAAGAMRFGLPTISDSGLPPIARGAAGSQGQTVARVPLGSLLATAMETRGMRIRVAGVPVPVPYGPAFAGERIRRQELHLEMGGPQAAGVQLLVSAASDEVEDGRVTVVGPEVGSIAPGGTIPLGMLVEVCGRNMQKDLEPVLERHLHHFMNDAEGLVQVGQRDLVWLRLSQRAAEAGFRLEHLGRIVHARLHADFAELVEKAQVTVYSRGEEVEALLARARAVYRARDERIGSLTDEDVDVFYSCIICQSHAPNHVCILTPERPGLCGAYDWLDGKAAFAIDPTGPSRPIHKGVCLDANGGRYQGVDAFVREASHGAIGCINLNSILEEPMASSECCEAVTAVLPLCNGVMTVTRDHPGMTPSGMTFSTLAELVGGGVQTPGLMGHARRYVGSKKFISAEGGVTRLVWMPRSLKEELRRAIEEAGAAAGYPDLCDKIATEEDAVGEEGVLAFLAGVGHPALALDPLF